MTDLHPNSEEVLIQKFPHYKTYQACQSRAFATSSFTLLIVGASSFLASDIFKQRFIPGLNKNWLVGGPFIIGVISAYAVAQHMTANCKYMWMAMEEKHSVLTPASERTAITEKEIA